MNSFTHPILEYFEANSWSEMFNFTSDRYEVTNLFNNPTNLEMRNGLRAEFDRLMNETGLAARFTNVVRSGNSFQAGVMGGMGPRYQFEGSTNLQTWNTVSEIKMSAAQTNVADSNAVTSKKFYRLNWISD
jgi:hypothetical protein